MASAIAIPTTPQQLLIKNREVRQQIQVVHNWAKRTVDQDSSTYFRPELSELQGHQTPLSEIFGLTEVLIESISTQCVNRADGMENEFKTERNNFVILKDDIFKLKIKLENIICSRN